MSDSRIAFRDPHPDWISLPRLFRANGDALIRMRKICNGGAGGPTLVTPRHPVPGRPTCDPMVEPGNWKAAHFDRIVVPDGQR